MTGFISPPGADLNLLNHLIISAVRMEPELVPEEQRWSIPNNTRKRFPNGNFIIPPTKEVEGYIKHKSGLLVSKRNNKFDNNDWDYVSIIKPADTIDRILSVYKIILISHECSNWTFNEQLKIYQLRKEYHYPFSVEVDNIESSMMDWCKEYCKMAWNYHSDEKEDSFSFNNENDAIWFKLSCG